MFPNNFMVLEFGTLVLDLVLDIDGNVVVGLNGNGFLPMRSCYIYKDFLVLPF